MSALPSTEAFPIIYAAFLAVRRRDCFDDFAYLLLFHVRCCGTVYTICILASAMDDISPLSIYFHEHEARLGTT
jgi:hypothetical protein